MIGDWVEVFDAKRVESIGPHSVLCEGIVRWLDQLEVRPIPLTPEILEKNGFHFGYTASEADFCGATGCGYPEKGWCYDEGDGEIKIIFPTESDGGMIRLDDENFDRHFELIYVKPIMLHELQHALLICGINKEIKL